MLLPMCKRKGLSASVRPLPFLGVLLYFPLFSAHGVGFGEDGERWGVVSLAFVAGGGHRGVSALGVEVSGE